MLKTLFIIISVSVFSSPLFAQDKGPPVPDYPAEKLTDNIYIIHGPITTPNPENQGFMNNPGIVLTTKGAVIIDPGGTVQSGEMVLRVLKTITDQPVIAVFNTHVHGDHWLGNQAMQQQYPDAPIYAHPLAIQQGAAGTGQEWVDLMEQSTDGKSRGTRVVTANTIINHGDRITVGETTFDIMHYGVAHTDNDIMIAVNGNKALFMGDNLFNGRMPRTEHGNIKGVIDSCNKALEIQPEVIIPGHGRSGGVAMYRHAINLVHILHKTVKQQYDLGLNDFEMKAVVVQALDAYKDWINFDFLIGKTISQTFLEIEQAAF